jgi:predicted Fe-Mo cluster-binding NifX family protein
VCFVKYYLTVHREERKKRNIIDICTVWAYRCITGRKCRKRAEFFTYRKIMDREIKKIAVSSEGPTLDDKVDPRFGRAGGFMIVDVATMQGEYIDNGTSQVMSQGAGIQAAEYVAGAGADVLLSGYVGPKAFQALNAVGITVGQDCDKFTVRKAVEMFLAGKVPAADGPNREGHT